jgi:hypothetical protein
MAEIAIPLGKEARLYYGVPNGAVTTTASAGVLEAAGFEIQGIRDATITLEKEIVECQRRRTHGWEDTRESFKRLSISFDMPNVYDGGVEQAAIVVIRNTFLSGTYNAAGAVSGICCYALASKAGAVAGEPGPQAVAGDGICADFIVTKFERGEPFGDVQGYSVELKMTQAHCGTVSRIPAWV